MRPLNIPEVPGLRPTLVLNIILITLILGVFGGAHTWLGMQQQQKDREITRTQDRIQQLNNEIRRLEVDVNHSLSNGNLFSQMESLGVKLQLIKPEEIISMGPIVENSPSTN
jgi:hypothetical protein